MRWLRNYELKIITPDGIETTVRPPLRIAFRCIKSISQGLNNLKLHVFNLKEANRLKIVKDKLENKKINVQLKLGYIDRNLETVFKGNVFFSSNMREGANFVSRLDCLDGMFDYTNGFTSKSVSDANVAAKTLIEDMPNTEIGKITTLEPFLRPKVMVGNSYALFDSLAPSDGAFYVDNEQVFILKDDEVISRFIPIVSAETGLMNTPERENQKITFSTLINPALKLGSRCQIKSTVSPHLNGIYKIETMIYKGDYNGQDWSQTVTALGRSRFKVI